MSLAAFQSISQPGSPSTKIRPWLVVSRSLDDRGGCICFDDCTVTDPIACACDDPAIPGFSSPLVRNKSDWLYTAEMSRAKLRPNGLFGTFQILCGRIRHVVRKCAGKKSYNAFGSFTACFGLYIFKMPLLSGVSQFRGIFNGESNMKAIKMESAKLANLALLVKKAK